MIADADDGGRQRGRRPASRPGGRARSSRTSAAPTTSRCCVVRTDRPYDYEPGQYASIETPYRPRSWRTYSMATAPSPDGLLEFHVRAVGAGWVSGPLVWRAQVGRRAAARRADGRHADRPAVPARHAAASPAAPGWRRSRRWSTAWPAGTPPAASRCSSAPAGPATSTTWAPLHRLAAMNRWLTVVPVVSDDPSFNGEQGLLPDVGRAAPARGATTTSSSAARPDMTRATVSRLTALGVPADRMTLRRRRRPAPGRRAGHRPAPHPRARHASAD